MPTIADSVLLIVRLTLAVYVLHSGISKIRYRREFLEAISNYNIFSPQAAGTVGAFLPWIEITLGIAFLIGLAPPVSALCLIGLLTIFTVFMVVNIRRGRIIDCGCYGIASTKTIGWGAIVRNLLLTGLALIQVGFSAIYAGDSVGLAGSGLHTDAAVVSSFPDALLVFILVAFSLIFISLVEWAIHTMSQAAILQGIRFE